MAGCLGDETIAAYVDGALAPDDVGRVDGHIDRCATCRTQLSAMAATPRSFVGSSTAGIAELVLHVGKDPDVPLPASVLGRYRIDGVIGKGGMGVVVRARDPELERDIAIKLVDPASGWHGRLRSEARAMAKLRHPNVVAVHDVGAVGDQLFVAMELVDGESLGAHLAHDRSRALALCIAAGRGLCAAHAAGLVHGDVKPDNILVDRDGRALVGDFGLARAIVLRTADAGDDRRALVGTPAYMAPELLRGEPATPASDQFALAVTIHEAISGTRPWRTAGIDGLRPAPPRPRGMSRAVWRVVSRALAPDPADRFASLDRFVDALDRAARPSRAVWIAGGVAAIAAAGGIALALVPRSAGCTDPIERAAAFALASPCSGAACSALASQLAGRAASWRATHVAVCTATRDGSQSAELLDRRMHCLDQRLLEHAALAGRLASPLGNAAALDAIAALHRLDPPASCESFDRPGAGPRPESAVAETWVATAKADAALGHYKQGVAGLAPHVAAIEALGDPSLLARTQAVLGQLHTSAGELAAAETAFDTGLRAAAAAGDDAETARLLLQLAHVVGEDRQQWQRGAELLRAADAAIVRAGDPPELQATLLLDRGLAAEDQDDYATAATDYTHAVEIRRRAGDPGDVANALELLCGVEGKTGALDTARDHCREAFELQSRSLGADHPLVAEAETNLGVAIAMRGDLVGARRTWESALARLERSVGGDAPALAAVLLNLADVSTALREPDAADRYLKRAIAVSATAETGAANLDVQIRAASVLRARGKLDDAIRLLEELVRRAEATLGPAHRTTGHALEDLAATYYDASRMTDARATFERAIAAATQIYGERHPTTLGIAGRYGQVLMELGDAKAARAVFERVMFALEAAVKPDAPVLAQAYTNYADSLLALGDAARAEAIAAKGVAIRDKLADDPLQSSEARFILGKAMWRARRDPAAVAVVTKARDEMRAMGAAATSLPDVERWLAGTR
jgi:tetratricopeptide (TPR) repeat protein